MSQSKQSLNEIRRGYAKKLKPLQIYALDSPDQDVPSIQVNRNNWNTIKSVFVTSLPEELSELTCDATKKSFIKYQKSQQQFSKQIHQGIVKLAKDHSIMEDTDEFYDDGNQFDDARFEFVDSSRRLQSKSEDKHEREVLFFFWREYNIYRRDVCPRNTRKKYIPKHEWEEPEHETFLEYYIKKRTDPSKCYLSPYITEDSYNIPVNQLVDFFYAELSK
jgi:hypothetical protein